MLADVCSGPILNFVLTSFKGAHRPRRPSKIHASMLLDTLFHLGVFRLQASRPAFFVQLIYGCMHKLLYVYIVNKMLNTLTRVSVTKKRIEPNGKCHYLLGCHKNRCNMHHSRVDKLEEIEKNGATAYLQSDKVILQS